MLVKICGVTREQDAELCAAIGVDFLGLNFWPRSSRCVTPQRAESLASAARAVRSSISVVGVFVNPSDAEIAAADQCGLDYIQLHGDESRERVEAIGPRAFKALSVASAADIERALAMPGELVLLDTPCRDYGGSGRAFDWSLCEPLRTSERTWFLAGGLGPKNVAEAISVAHPSGVDVASGVEAAPGIKDHDKTRAFVRAAKASRSAAPEGAR